MVVVVVEVVMAAAAVVVVVTASSSLHSCILSQYGTADAGVVLCLLLLLMLVLLLLMWDAETQRCLSLLQQPSACHTMWGRKRVQISSQHFLQLLLLLQAV